MPGFQAGPAPASSSPLLWGLQLGPPTPAAGAGWVSRRGGLTASPALTAPGMGFLRLRLEPEAAAPCPAGAVRRRPPPPPPPHSTERRAWEHEKGSPGAHAPASHPPQQPSWAPRGLSFPVSKAESRREGQEGAFGQWSWPLNVHVPAGDEGLTVRWAWGAPGMEPDPPPLPAAWLPGPHCSRTLASAALAPGKAWRAPHLRLRCGELLSLLLPESRDCRALVAGRGSGQKQPSPSGDHLGQGAISPACPPTPTRVKGIGRRRPC